MVAVSGQEDVVAYELTALESNQICPLEVVVCGCPHHWGLIQFYRFAAG